MKSKGQKVTILIILFILGIKIGYSQCDYSRYGNAPRELTVGRISEPGMRGGHPYTLFVKTDNFNLEEAISKIRLELFNGLPKIDKIEFPSNSYADLYKGIWQNANLPEPGKCPEEDGCEHPKWVKNNAIIHLIGLRYEKTESDKDTLILMGNEERDEYAVKAYDGLKNLNPNVEGCPLGKCGFLRRKAFDLIQYAESYDILKATFLANYDDKNDGASCSPRNKLRVFTRNFHVVSRHVINSNIGWKKNHGIICASALGISALVLNDAGVERGWIGNGRGIVADVVKVLNGIFNVLTFKSIPQPNYSPINWYQRAHGTGKYGETDLFLLAFGEDGIEDNFFVGKHKLVIDVPQSNSDGTAGFAEGPAYFADLSQALLPYFRASANFYSTAGEKNYLSQSKYQNMLNWYQDILNHDGSVPTYDNSELNWGNLLGIIGEEEFLGEGKWISQRIIDHSLMDLRGDFIIALGEINRKKEPDAIYINKYSGNIILRNENSKSEQTFHMLCEKEYAVDQSAGFWDGTHEDDDLGSFMIYASDLGKKSIPLAIDPPYFGWDEFRKAKETNKFWMHNTIEIDDGLPAKDHLYAYPKFLLIDNGEFSKIQEFKLSYDFLDENLLQIESAVTRNVIVINESENLYYFINDLVDIIGIDSGAGDFQYINLNLNGNGNKYLNEGAQYQDSLTYRKVNGLHRWTYPCSVEIGNRSSQWSLSAHISALNNSISGKGYWEDAYTNDTWDNGSKASGIAGSGNTLSRLRIHQPVQQTIFQTFLYPQKCDDALPIIKKYEGSNYVSTDINFISGKDTSFEARLGKNITINFVNDTACHLHLTRWEGNIPDSASNPFNLPNQANNKLYFDAQKLFVNYHTLAYMGKGYKYCPPSYAKFRTATISNGSYLIYKDTLVYSDVPLNFDYSIAGRQTYSCSITPLAAVTSGDSIKLKLPDVARGIDMIALVNANDTLKSRYDSLTNYIYIALPSVTKQFTIQEKDRCNDCYFPPLGTHIDTLFVADDKNTHSIPRPLKINYPHGQMQITNSTKISMCEGVYLFNKDSLIIEGPPQSKGMVIPSCAGIDSIAKGSDNSMLIVNAGSALVLNAGSRTYVKNGGAIYVKQNGSLVIKDGAFLQIGDSGRAGWGEVIVEGGGNVYIEPYAHIEYRRKIGDTSDINLFSIAVGNNAAYAGVYFIMDSILKAENIIASNIYPIAICDLDSLNPLVNPEFGYTNFGKPKSTIQLRSLVLCPNEPLHISLDRIINDASAEITVCRWDSIFANNRFSHMECVNDSIVLDSMPPDPICRLPRILPEDWTYYFGVNTRHQVSISVMNECGKRHDTSILVIVTDTPKFSITVPATACEGFNTVSVLAAENSHDSVQYAFEVTEMVDTNSINYQIGNPGEVYSYSHYGMLPDTFNFPGYYFKGGRSYLVSLSLTNGCGTRTQEGEVQIPSGAYIELERSTAYANPVHGARSVQLHGYISSADSFRWEPTTWLNRTDTLVVTSTPEDSIYYVLIAKEDNCTALDTVFIRYNHVANAGEGDTVCFNNGKVILGNPYDLSVFLGFLYYKGGSTFRNEFMASTTADNEYFKQFSLFMHSDLFKNWAIGCNTIYTDFTEDLNRERTVKQPWFINYFEQLTRFDNSGMAALDTFNYYINQDSVLQYNYTNTNIYGSYAPCIQSMLSYYDDFKLTQINDVSIAWYKIVEEDTSFNGSLQESALAVDEPTKTTTYVQQVITPYYAEIDETIVWVDTVMTVNFAPQFQFDSTVVFQDLSAPTSAGSLFSWDFGDGSAGSTEQFPTHEFPAFDTAFKVCLSITNNCGTQSFCDTVYIDSAHWGGSMYTKGIGSNSQAINPQSEFGIQALFYPNPTFGNGILAYIIEDSFEKGELKFYDSFGKLVFETSINKTSDQVKIPLESNANGLYFYTLQTNTGAYVNGKIVKM